MPEQFCPACNKDTLTIVEAVYEGFTRVGEQRRCAVCGHVFDAPAAEAPEAVTPVKRKLPPIFSDDDLPGKIDLFAEDENKTLCRYCAHYTVNPFRQWCGLHRKDVEATDTCDRFEAGKESGSKDV